VKSGKKLKNVRLEKFCQNGHDNWRLFHIDANGEDWQDPYFSIFAEHLLPGESSGADAWNTRFNYTHQVPHFIDYMIEAINYLVEHGNHDMNGEILARLIRKYSNFLSEAQESGDPLVAEVAKRLNATPCNKSTQSVYIGAVNKYLDLSEYFNSIMRDLGICDIHGTPLYSEADLFPETLGKMVLPNKERMALNKNSMLAGVMSGGARLKRIAKLKPSKKVVKRDVEKKGIDLEEFYQQDHFPFEFGPRLIVEGFHSLRDKVLFCLLMACGCRLHEVLLLTWRDIDTARQLVRLRCPHDKTLEDFGGFFHNSSEILALPWKGRITERTALIEPYRTHFWRLLTEYQQSKEFTITNSHNFIFQVIKGVNKGAPLVMSDSSNIGATMAKACKKIGISPRRPHTLRHMYGVYCLNFIAFDDGSFGMGLLAVRDLMGHASSTSTQRYAIPDTQLQMLRQKISFAALRDFSVNTSTELRLELMKKEFEDLKEAIAREKLLNAA
jgi:integrase